MNHRPSTRIVVANAVFLFVMLPSAGGRAWAADESPAGNLRRGTFHYRFELTDLKPGADLRIWLPMATTTPEQDVKRLTATAPCVLTEHVDNELGNYILYGEMTVPGAGAVEFDVPYEFERREAGAGDRKAPRPQLDADLRARLLQADSLVPITGKPVALLTGLKLPADKFQLARRLYDLVDDRMTYKKESTGWGRGDVNWACDSRYGNCTDFHSLFMALGRSQGIPCRFEIGFPLGADDGPVTSYHCWAWFFTDDHGWTPVDISEANKHPKLRDYYFGHLSPDRIAFSTGRDIRLTPAAGEATLNFFIAPHVEIDGKAIPAEQIQLRHCFRSTH